MNKELKQNDKMKTGMKMAIVLIILVVAGLAVRLFMSNDKKDGSYSIEIYADNDVHGKYFDSLYTGGIANRTSLANISSYLKQRREAVGEENIVFLDLGDNLQGDNAAYYFNYVEPQNGEKHLFSRIASYLKYDAIVVGNHDIETGHPVYDRLKKELEMPYLAANAVDEKMRGPYFAPYTILHKAGLKIAVIGMTNPNIRKWLPRALWDGLDFLPICRLADSLVNVVHESERPDLTILAIHAGLGDGTQEDMENPARYLAANVKGVDIVLASHDHKVANEKIWNGRDSVLLMEAGSRAAYLMEASVKLEYRKGKLVDKSVEGTLIPMEGIPADKEYLAHFRADYDKVKAFTVREVGRITEPIETHKAFFGPSVYMDLIHKVQLDSTGADISMASILTPDKTVGKGMLDYQDMFTIYPYENQLYVIQLTGKQVKGFLEYSYGNWIHTMTRKEDHLLDIAYNDKSGRYGFRNMTFNFTSAAGIDYEVDVTKPYGEKINILSFSDGRKFFPDSVYRVAISSYTASGGGDILEKGALIPRDQLESIVIDIKPEVRDLIYRYFQKKGVIEPVHFDNWKFIPQAWTVPAASRDEALMFRKKETEQAI